MDIGSRSSRWLRCCAALLIVLGIATLGNLLNTPPQFQIFPWMKVANHVTHHRFDVSKVVNVGKTYGKARSFNIDSPYQIIGPLCPAEFLDIDQSFKVSGPLFPADLFDTAPVNVIQIFESAPPFIARSFEIARAPNPLSLAVPSPINISSTSPSPLRQVDTGINNSWRLTNRSHRTRHRQNPSRALRMLKLTVKCLEVMEWVKMIARWLEAMTWVKMIARRLEVMQWIDIIARWLEFVLRVKVIPWFHAVYSVGFKQFFVTISDRCRALTDAGTCQASALRQRPSERSDTPMEGSPGQPSAPSAQIVEMKAAASKQEVLLSCFQQKQSFVACREVNRTGSAGMSLDPHDVVCTVSGIHSQRHDLPTEDYQPIEDCQSIADYPLMEDYHGDLTRPDTSVGHWYGRFNPLLYSKASGQQARPASASLPNDHHPGLTAAQAVFGVEELLEMILVDLAHAAVEYELSNDDYHQRQMEPLETLSRKS